MDPTRSHPYVELVLTVCPIYLSKHTYTVQNTSEDKKEMKKNLISV